MHYLWLWAFVFAASFYQPNVQTDKIIKVSFDVGGQARTFFLFAPKTAPEATAPLMLILHGSGMDGRSLMEEWKELAKKEGIILAAPNSLSAGGWSLEHDGPAFIHKLMAAVKAKHPFDERRVYLFGYSGGAVYALQLSLLESEYFAATAVYAGAIDSGSYNRLAQAKRKIPIALFVGTNDPFFPIPKVQATRNLLKQSGFPVLMKEIFLDEMVHGHDYFSVARTINRHSWNFFKNYKLDATPTFRRFENNP